MTMIKNLNRHAIVTLTTGSKDGVPTVESLRPGDSRNIDISADNLQVAALHLAGQIAVGTEARGAVSPTPASKEKAA